MTPQELSAFEKLGNGQGAFEGLRDEAQGDVAASKLALILRAIRAGRTVYLCTHTHATKITPRTFERFEASGRPVVKASNGSLWLSEGRRYVCADYCAIRVEGAA